MYTRVYFASTAVHVWLSTNNTIFEEQAQYYINHLAQPAQRSGAATSILYCTTNTVQDLTHYVLPRHTPNNSNQC